MGVDWLNCKQSSKWTKIHSHIYAIIGIGFWYKSTDTTHTKDAVSIIFYLKCTNINIIKTSQIK